MDNFYASYSGVDGGGGGGGVTTLNGQSGALTLIAGSGITITPGAGTLTIDASGGGGANTALSNLAAVAINTSLLPATNNSISLGSVSLAYANAFANILKPATNTNLSILTNDRSTAAPGSVTVQGGDYTGAVVSTAGGPVILRGGGGTRRGGSANVQGGTAATRGGDVSITGGDATTSGASGSITISGGNSVAADTGFVLMQTSAANTGFSSGVATIQTGDSPDINSGEIDIITGQAPGGISGNILLQIGTAATPGFIRLVDSSLAGATNGDVWTLQDQTTGAGYWQPGGSGGATIALDNLALVQINSDLVFSPAVTAGVLRTENTTGASNDSKPLNLTTGTVTNSLSGILTLKSGAVTSGFGLSGNVLIGSGDNAGSDTSGDVLISSGTVGNNTSGLVSVRSGVSSINASGAVTLGSGNSELNTGLSSLVSGNSTSGNSGNVRVASGTAAGTRGDILLDSRFVGVGISTPARTIHQQRGEALSTYHQWTAGTVTGITADDGLLVGIDGAGSADVMQMENNTLTLGTNGTMRQRLTGDGALIFENIVTPGGTTGDQTINTISGTVNFATAASSLTVTSAITTVDSIVFAVIRTNDTTATIKNVVPSAGSFTINLDAAAAAETSVGFMVINQ